MKRERMIEIIANLEGMSTADVKSASDGMDDEKLSEWVDNCRAKAIVLLEKMRARM